MIPEPDDPRGQRIQPIYGMEYDRHGRLVRQVPREHHPDMAPLWARAALSDTAV